MTSLEPSWEVRQYFVDEAGDPTLFNRHGTAIIGRPGCSSHFMLGFVEVDDEPRLTEVLESLRRELLANPALKDVPSMQPQRRKTAEAFHAKDDHPVVRRRVFDLLARQSFRFFAVVWNKQRVLEDVLSTQRLVPTYRYSENALYDSMVGRLLRDRLHLDDCAIIFARRGASSRTTALMKAIEGAKDRFQAHWNIQVERQPTIAAAYPRQFGGLQAADYCLWSLQRLICRGDESEWVRVLPHVVEVVAMASDSGAEKTFGRSNSLRLSSWKLVPGI